MLKSGKCRTSETDFFYVCCLLSVVSHTRTTLEFYLCVQSERLDKWGSCWRRYYQLETSFYISDLAESVIRRITENSFWKENFTNTLGGSKEAKKEDTKFLKDVGKKVGSINLDKGKAVASTGNPERGTMVVGPGEGGGGGGVGESEVKGKVSNNVHPSDKYTCNTPHSTHERTNAPRLQTMLIILPRLTASHPTEKLWLRSPATPWAGVVRGICRPLPIL